LEPGAALVFTGNVVICADHGGAFDWDVEVGMLAAAVPVFGAGPGPALGEGFGRSMVISDTLRLVSG
jgi:hypothetical protein